ncbi:PREDICTED: ephrin type-A receptor 8-like [Bison bison bison]|uniref:Ephrin type-A receptor 8-like n=1 Tax=Bison bison bison TaxID=43346 RepID=A0A6P3GG60_BISBB|nr:PREDICTED: ephrin type-A receptor 8-like [Bison bison bison]
MASRSSQLKGSCYEQTRAQRQHPVIAEGFADFSNSVGDLGSILAARKPGSPGQPGPLAAAVYEARGWPEMFCFTNARWLIWGCPSGTFKANQGDEACTHCPINSRTTSEGATNCVCRNGYYRADLDPVDMPCTTIPSAPQAVISSVNETSLMLDDLLAHTQYTFEIQAVNGVTDQSPFSPQFASVNITTNQAASTLLIGPFEAESRVCLLSNLYKQKRQKTRAAVCFKQAPSAVSIMHQLHGDFPACPEPGADNRFAGRLLDAADEWR